MEQAKLHIPIGRILVWIETLKHEWALLVRDTIVEGMRDPHKNNKKLGKKNTWGLHKLKNAKCT
jgi:hypothetical protein